MTSPSPPSRRRRATGDEASQALADVLRDQAERAERRSTAPVRRRDPTRVPLAALAVVLAAVAVWLWLAPPALLAPPSLEPTADELETGVRMEMYTTALAVARFREEEGRLPGSLDELDEPPDPAVTYQRLGGDAYRLIGHTGEAELRWASTEPYRALLGMPPGSGLPRSVR